MGYLGVDGLHIGQPEAEARFAIKERFGSPVVKKRRLGEIAYELSLSSKSAAGAVRLHFVEGGNLVHIQGGEIAVIPNSEFVSSGEKILEVTKRLGPPAALFGNEEKGVIYYLFEEKALGIHYNGLKIISLDLFFSNGNTGKTQCCRCKLPSLSPDGNNRE